MIKAILFDLDGTLLPMDQDEFTKGYFKLLAAKLAPYGYEPKTLIDTIWAGTAAMVKNTGAQTNEAAFWERFSRTYGAEKTEKDKPLFEEFYADDFERASVFCPRNDKAAETVAKLQQLGYRVALATNPIFPSIATCARIRWAGLAPEDFAFVTTYGILQAESRLLPGCRAAARAVARGMSDGRQRRAGRHDRGNDRHEGISSHRLPYQPGRCGHLRLAERRL